MVAVSSQVAKLAADEATATQQWMIFTGACRDYADVHVRSDAWLVGGGGPLAWSHYLELMLIDLKTGKGAGTHAKPQELVKLDHETKLVPTR